MGRNQSTGTMKTLSLFTLLCLLTGCIPFIDHNGPRRKWYYLSDAPPIPREVEPSVKESLTAAVVIPPETKTIALTWDYPPHGPEITFNVYSSAELMTISQWSLLTNVSVKIITVPVNEPRRFFAVKARNELGIESAWATK